MTKKLRFAGLNRAPTLLNSMVTDLSSEAVNRKEMKALIKEARKLAKPFLVTDDNFRLKDIDPAIRLVCRRTTARQGSPHNGKSLPSFRR
jgi:hypothetical protein